MGRPRAFDLDEVLDHAVDVFVDRGFAGASVDDVLAATGLARASLYNAFGSKRGVLEQALGRIDGAPRGQQLDLLLVALSDVAPHDEGIRRMTRTLVERLGERPDRVLGARLLARAGLRDHEEET